MIAATGTAQGHGETGTGLGWGAILRLGLAQMALGAVVVLTTSTLNRVMVVELALPAMLPGALVGFHHAIQMLRPRWGYGSDLGGRRTPWIIGGMAVLCLGGALAAVATALMGPSFALGLGLAMLAFLLIGLGVGAAGTSLLVMLTTEVAPARRPTAAAIVWMMMILGFAVTAGSAGHFLDPYSPERLMAVVGTATGLAFVVATLSVWGLEGQRRVAVTLSGGPASGGPANDGQGDGQGGAKPSFLAALNEVWGEAKARQFTVFVFVSMLAFAAQDLILEPFGGLIFGMTPGESTQLAGTQNAGVLLGMILVAVACSGLVGARLRAPRFWTVAGCLASACALGALALSGHMDGAWPLSPIVFSLGLSNGAFAVAAIGSMVLLADEGRQSREGLRMGLWGASQAIAFALGGFLGTVAVDVVRYAVGSPLMAYSAVFAAEAVLFVVAGILALGIHSVRTGARQGLMAEAVLAGAGMDAAPVPNTGRSAPALSATHPSRPGPLTPAGPEQIASVGA